MLFNFGIHRVADQLQAGKGGACKLPFDDLEAAVLSIPHSADIRIRSGVDPAKFHEQVFNIAGEFRGSGSLQNSLEQVWLFPL